MDALYLEERFGIILEEGQGVETLQEVHNSWINELIEAQANIVDYEKQIMELEAEKEQLLNDLVAERVNTTAVETQANIVETTVEVESNSDDLKQLEELLNQKQLELETISDEIRLVQDELVLLEAEIKPGEQSIFEAMQESDEEQVDENQSVEDPQVDEANIERNHEDLEQVDEDGAPKGEESYPFDEVLQLPATGVNMPICNFVGLTLLGIALITINYFRKKY